MRGRRPRGAAAAVPGANRWAVKFGAEHRVPVEITHAGYAPEDDWWYHGAMWVRESRPVTSSEFDPELTDPTHEPIVRMLKDGWSDERIALALIDPNYTGGDHEPSTLLRGSERYRAALTSVQRVRGAQEHAADPHVLRFYGLIDATKTEERVLATIDQDLIAEAPMVRYIETRKGRRIRTYLLVAAALLPYLAFLALLPVLTGPTGGPADPTTGATQLTTDVVLATLLVAIPEVGLIVGYLMLRRTRVLDMQVSPLVGTDFGAHTELAFLTNSNKTAVSRYIARIHRYSSDAIEKFATLARNLETDLIAQKDEEIETLRYQLDNVKIGSLDATAGSIDLGLMGYRGPPSVFTGMSTFSIIVLLVVVGVAAVGVTWAAIASGL